MVPDRFLDNYQSGYGVWMPNWSWAPEEWKQSIETAYRRSQSSAASIRNGRAKMERNTR